MKCPASGTELETNLTLASSCTCVFSDCYTSSPSRAVRIGPISQLHPTVNFCNPEARDLFCQCCLPSDCVGTGEALADKVEEHMASI